MNVVLSNAPVSGDLTLLSVLVLAFPDDEGVFEPLDKSSNWYSPGGTFPVLYLLYVTVIVFIIFITIMIMTPQNHHHDNNCHLSTQSWQSLSSCSSSSSSSFSWLPWSSLSSSWWSSWLSPLDPELAVRLRADSYQGRLHVFATLKLPSSWSFMEILHLQSLRSNYRNIIFIFVLPPWPV